MRKFLSALLLAVALVAVMASSAFAQAPQGIYVGDQSQVNSDFQWLKSIGMQFVITQPSEAAANAAAANGLGVYWNIDYRGGNSAYNGEAAMINKPVTWGWYIADEPPSSDVATLNNFQFGVKWVDPQKRPTLAVHWGCTYSAARGSAWPFRFTEDQIGTDCYPLVDNSSSTSYACSAYRGGASVASDSGYKLNWDVVQAASWNSMGGGPSGSRTPLPSEMAAMRNCAVMKAGARFVAYYSLDSVKKDGPLQMDRLRRAVQAAWPPCC